MATRTWTGAVSSDVQVAGNYLEAAVPTTGDDLYVRARLLVDATDGDVDMDANLDMSAVRLASLHIEQSFTGNVGTTIAPLEIGAVSVEIGRDYGFGDPPGSPLIHLDIPFFSGYTTTIVVYDSAGVGENEELPPVRILTHDPTAHITVKRGLVGIGVLEEAGELETLDVSYVDQVSNDARVVVGRGIILAFLNQTGGDVTFRASGQEVRIVLDDGFLRVQSIAGLFQSFILNRGTLVATGDWDATLFQLYGGQADFLDGSEGGWTITAFWLSPAGVLRCDPSKLHLTTLGPLGRLSISCQPV